jgi:GTP-binding protein
MLKAKSAAVQPAGRQVALVDDQPSVAAVTAVRAMQDCRAGQVVDTAGWEDDDPETLPGPGAPEPKSSLVGADVALMVIDARAWITRPGSALWLQTKGTGRWWPTRPG